MDDRHRSVQIIGQLNEAGHEAYLVGGCVRDALLGVAAHDFDICTSATPAQVEALFAAAGFPVIETGIEHGTVTVLCGGEPFEITTFRGEGTYSDGRHPDKVHFVRTIEEDLARRDFTINAMAWSPQRGLVDPFDGQADLRAGVIRAVGCARERFHEDGLRVMRALRFAAVLGFRIEPQTARAVVEEQERLQLVAAERVREELLKMLCGKNFVPVALEFREVLAQRLPHIRSCFDFDQQNSYHAFDVWEHCVRSVTFAPENDPIMRLALLIHDIGKPATFVPDEADIGHCYGHAKVGAEMARDICNSLKLSTAEKQRVVHLVQYHDFMDPQTPKAMRRMLAKHGLQGTQDLYAVHWADVCAMKPPEQPINMQYISRARELLEEALAEPTTVFSLKNLQINGRDLIEMGVEEGLAIGHILHELFERVVDGELPNERAALLKAASEVRYNFP